MGEIIMPDGRRLDMTEPTIVEQQMLGLLNTIARLLDMLVRLECGVLKRADLKRDIIETEAAIAEAQRMARGEVTAEEAVQAAEDAEHGTEVVEA